MIEQRNLLLIISITVFQCLLKSSNGESFDYPTANLSTTWVNSFSAPHSVNFSDGSKVRAILVRGSYGPKFACGFFCNGSCDGSLFAIFIVQTNSGSGITLPSSGFPPVVWSANRANPVDVNSSLQLTPDGDLVLRASDGTSVWSTNTAGKSVTGLNLTETGNLLLHDAGGAVIWQSFDHPTDALVPQQKLISGQKLTATSNRGGFNFSLVVNNDGMFASIESNPPQVYSDFSVYGKKDSKDASYVKFQNGSLGLYIHSFEPNAPDRSIPIPQALSAQYMKLEPDGHLRVYEWRNGWLQVADLLTGYLGDCKYPLVCGEYGMCSSGQCACPRARNDSAIYFTPVDDMQPNFGCSRVNPLICNSSSRYHSFVELHDMTYFTFEAHINVSDMSRCKNACLANCSCKAAVFQYGSDPTTGRCYLPSEVFSMMKIEKDKIHYNSSVFLKVQLSPSPPDAKSSPRAKFKIPVILGLTLGAFALLLLLIALTVLIIQKKKGGEKDEDYLEFVSGMPTRFSFDDLKTATQNFSLKLGEGGFGSVFQGSLKDGTKVAVKWLDGIGQVKKSFLAEVETMGNIHHVNLVRLVGFCAENSHRLLVYEYMVNGSLEKWIYKGSQEPSVDWNCRRKIVVDIAKGLSYLHEDCRQKILHLDIKPQNILLDENFNAKLSDFGLAKLISRDQAEVVTTMRGTPGYLAPEWLSSIITEKVDVYSFGIVVLEILCGRKNFERSMPEEQMHLLSLFKSKAEEGKTLDIIDDMQFNESEVVLMLRVASWCLQSDYVNRPSMSMVVNVLEGLVDVDINVDHNGLLNPQHLPLPPHIGYVDTTLSTMVASVLSGPR
ncbi:unnamed protein product [Cuscuta epithymum]|uniref:Receptor-like serine/threonine-protein kinase n=1 Tax=Cuscuta epithymum TaxID=186058 RepID=A0AAV0GI06_9ASTE|nr:unnamed protein product [Cuscuta epithymum]